MVPSSLIPRSPEQLAVFAQDERYLLTTMIIISSRNNTSEEMRSIHTRSWDVMRGWISDIQCLGAPVTVGLVESLLLLAENLPRDPARSTSNRDEPREIHAIGFGEEVHDAENRQSWMLIGMAIRSAYGLGLDKVCQTLSRIWHIPDAISCLPSFCQIQSVTLRQKEADWLGRVRIMLRVWIIY
jgi:hypothetical protein